MISLYGLVKKQHALDIATAVCDCLGHGKHGVAVEMLMETCAAETGVCEVVDRHLYKLGVGANQTDENTFDWLMQKYGEGKHADNIRRFFGIELKVVQYMELAVNPLLSFIFARLLYMTRVEPIPKNRSARSGYWKRWYNSSRGKGSEQHYMLMCECTLDKLVKDGEIQ